MMLVLVNLFTHAEVVQQPHGLTLAGEPGAVDSAKMYLACSFPCTPLRSFTWMVINGTSLEKSVTISVLTLATNGKILGTDGF